MGSKPDPVPVGTNDKSDNSGTTNISVASKSRGRPRKSENAKKNKKEPLPRYAAFKPKENMKENSNKVEKAKKEELEVKDLKSKPKNLKDAKKNEEILNAHNNDHQDDLFKKNVTKKAAKKDKGKKASDILAEKPKQPKSKSTKREKKSEENQEKPTKKQRGRPHKNSKPDPVPEGTNDKSDNPGTTNISVASKSRGRPRKSENAKKNKKEPLPPYAAFKPKENMKENSNNVKKAIKEELEV